MIPALFPAIAEIVPLAVATGAGHFVVVVTLIYPGPEPAPTLELAREVIPASTPAYCRTYAAKRADEERARHAALVVSAKARVTGECRALIPPPRS